MAELSMAPMKQDSSGFAVLCNVGIGAVMTIAGATTPMVEYVSNVPPVQALTWETESVAIRFREHVANWKTEMRSSPSSSVVGMILNPHYQRIIGMGWAAVPYLLAELQASPDHWSWALEMITGENPVPPDAEGKLRAIAGAWIEWGRARRLV